MVIGSTTNIRNLDTSSLRPGRLEEHIHFLLPTPEMRLEMIKSLLKDIPLQKEDEREQIIQWLCWRTSDKSVAEIKGAISQAICLAMKESESIIMVTRNHFITSLDSGN